jgi:lethal(2) giant larvae protein
MQSPNPPLPFFCRLPFTIFQGGMPRASYGDRHCISVVHNGQQTAFDFTSRVIDFTVLAEADPAAGRQPLGVCV